MANEICAVLDLLTEERQKGVAPGGEVAKTGIQTFIGIDLHKDSLTWCARNENGKELGVGKIATKCRDKIVDFVNQWPKPVAVAVEAVGFYRWLWLLLEPHVDFLSLADTARLKFMMERQISRVKRDLSLQIESMPAIHEDIKRLSSVPGVATLVAAAVLTETGGLSRFDNPEQLACYSGLTTRTFQSADTVRHGHISNAGPPNLRWDLQQAAWVAIRCNPYVRQVYNRITRRAGSKKTATAIARKLLIWMWAVHTHKTSCQDLVKFPRYYSLNISYVNMLSKSIRT